MRRHGYRLRGDYARQLDALYAQFPREQVLLLSSRELRDNPTGSVRKVCGFLGIEPLPGSVLAETVFTGDYPRPARNSLRMRLLRWLLRRELRDMRERYGVEFD